MSDKLTTIVGLAMTLTVIFTPVSAIANLVAHWELDETSGETVHDTSGNGHDGKLLGGLVFDGNSVTGIVDRALSFDGKNDGILIGKSFSMPTDAFTIAFWFSPEAGMRSDSRRCNFIHWSKGGFPCIAFNLLGHGEIGLHFGNDDEGTAIVSSRGTWHAGTWYHIAITFDGTDFKIYVNGKLENSVREPGPHHGGPRFYVGIARDGKHPFGGTLDDICISGHAMSNEAIIRLRRADPVLQRLTDAVMEARQMITHNEPEKAETFLEERIARCKQWKRENPDTLTSAFEELSADLYYWLAKSQKAAGYPDETVKASYCRAFEEGIPSLADFASVLLWLFEGENTQEYQRVVGSLLDGDEDYLEAVVRKAEALVKSWKAELAVGFLETNVTTYLQWRQSHPYDQVDAETSLPAVYFQLAGAREAAGLGNKQIAEAYGKTFCGLDERHTDRQAKALMWLLENDCREVYAQIIELSRQSGPFESDYKRVIRRLCGRLESENNWVIFERFLDSLLADETYPFEWVGFVTSCLGSQGGDWSEKYFAYLESKGELRFARDCMAAEKHAAEGNYGKAAQLYRDIAKRCARDDDKRVYQLQLSKCLFKAGKYREAASGFERFVAAGPGAARAQMREAILTKGQCHIRLGEIDQALDEFLRLTLEYPEARQVPEAVFYIGYCHMLQNNFTAAAGAFEVVLQEYPESKYTNQAKRYLDRMRGLAG